MQSSRPPSSLVLARASAGSRGQTATFTLADGRLLRVTVSGSTSCDVAGEVLAATSLELFNSRGQTLSAIDLAAFLAVRKGGRR